MDEIIHYVNVPEGVCSRKDSGEDTRVEKQGQTTITFSALATFTGNVTCKRCKQWMKANRNRRAAMIVGKREHHAMQ
jgi:hypothetical protein